MHRIVSLLFGLTLLAAGFGNASVALAATVTGVVRDGTSGAPIAGAQVHVRAQENPVTAASGADGRFALPVDGAGATFQVSAAIAYDADAAVNYETTAVSTTPGSDITITLRRIPTTPNSAYQPIAAAPPSGCGSCHTEQYTQWQASNHAHAAQNLVLRDLYSGDGTSPRGDPASAGYVYLDTHAPPATGLCAVCHAPNERPADPGGVRFDAVASAPGLEGVTCTSCHQLHDVNANVRAIHLLGNAEFYFPAAFGGGGGNSLTHQHVWGPLDDVSFGQMRAAWAPVFKQSRYCASCHEYDNPYTGVAGQETYSEWVDSPAAAAGTPCQTCHMPQATQPGRIAAVNGAPVRPAAQRHDHSFPGVYSGRLGVPASIELGADPNAHHVDVTSLVRNLVQGHHFPTGVDVRNAFIAVEASIDGQALVQIGGHRIPDWADDAVPGQQPGDFAGTAGRGYAKVLAGRIGGVGDVVAPVPFIDAELVLARTTIPAGGMDIGHYRYALPDGVVAGDTLQIRARLIYRRAWRAIAVAKQWPAVVDGEPWQRVVVERVTTVTMTADMLDRIWQDGFEDDAPAE
jgi:hypothetical protein